MAGTCPLSSLLPGWADAVIPDHLPPVCVSEAAGWCEIHGKSNGQPVGRDGAEAADEGGQTLLVVSHHTDLHIRDWDSPDSRDLSVRPRLPLKSLYVLGRDIICEIFSHFRDHHDCYYQPKIITGNFLDHQPIIAHNDLSLLIFYPKKYKNYQYDQSWWLKMTEKYLPYVVFDLIKRKPSTSSAFWSLQFMMGLSRSFTGAHFPHQCLLGTAAGLRLV